MLAVKKEFDTNAWTEVYASKQNKQILTWTVTGVEDYAEQPCLIVSKDRTKGIIPLTESGVQLTENERINRSRLAALIGQEVSFMVISTDKKSDIFVASREKAMAKLSSVTWDKIKLGHTKTVVARRIVSARKKDGSIYDMGVSVEFDGVQAFLPVQEIAYGWIGQISDFIQPGDTFDAQVIEIDKEKSKILVSVKALYENPFPKCLDRYSKGGIYAGDVTGIAEYGVFVSLEQGVNALCSHPRAGKVNKGDKVAIIITRIENQRINGLISRIIRHA
ncbi:MAG: S1 RNA-binding domain-containing protein [Candidatus Pacebacteria bacterium]|nr:S1 RNA-binding domain-containing protein [Candidatus Paceibacterota bacterium]